MEKYNNSLNGRGETWLQQRIAYDKLEWYLEALGDSNYQKIIDKITENKAICKWQRSIPGGQFFAPSEGGFFIEKSPISSEDLIKLDYKAIAEYIRNFQPDPATSPEGPNHNGLAREFEKTLTADPNKFINNLEDFENIPSSYKYTLFNSLIEIVRKSDHFDEKKIFHFTLKLMNDQEFWKKVTISERFYSFEASLVGEVARLTREILLKRKKFIEKDLIVDSQKIIFTLLRNNTIIFDGKITLDDLINSISGKIYEVANILWSLIEEYNKIHPNALVRNEITQIIEENLSYNQSKDDFLFYFGSGFHSFWYYQKQWTIEKFEQLMISDAAKFAHVLNGLFETIPHVYMEIYEYFFSNGLFKKAIRLSNLSERAKENVAHYILIGGMEKGENVLEKKSLINDLIGSSDYYILSRIGWLFWKYTDRTNSKAQMIMPSVFKLIVGRLHEFEGEERNSILQHLNKWPELLDEWNQETVQLITKLAQLTSELHFSDYYIEAFTKHWEKTPDLVLDAYINILRKKNFPYYPDEGRRQLFEKICNKNRKIALEIYNLYTMQGIYDLKEIWERFGNNKS